MENSLKPRALSQEEEQMLELLAGNVPPHQLDVEYNKWAIENGYPQRCRRGLMRSARLRGLSYEPHGEWVTAKYIAEVLGIASDVVYRWIKSKRYNLPFAKSGETEIQISFRRRDLVKFAKAHPSVFGGISCDRLFLLLEDRELAVRIAKRFPRKRNSATLVEAVELGRTFPSVSAAARAMFVRNQSINCAIKRGGTCAGYHWRHV